MKEGPRCYVIVTCKADCINSVMLCLRVRLFGSETSATRFRDNLNIGCITLIACLGGSSIQREPTIVVERENPGRQPINMV